jgi:hypothetical protein
VPYVKDVFWCAKLHFSHSVRNNASFGRNNILVDVNMQWNYETQPIITGCKNMSSFRVMKLHELEK